MSKRFLSLIIAVCILFTTVCSFSVLAEDSASTAESTDERRAELQSELDKINGELASLGSKSKETEEYLQALDRKIQYLNEQFELAKQDAKKLEERVNNLEKNISVNEQELGTIQTEVTSLEGDLGVLNEQFSSTYSSYCSRIRALYESGSGVNTLYFLFESDGIQNLLTRYEMVRAVSKRDGELLESVKEQTDRIVATTTKLNEKKTTLNDAQTKLSADRETLKTERTNLIQKQEDMQLQQAEIESQQLEANTLLQRINDKTKEYGEYRDITQAELDEIDAAIAEADKKYADAETTTKKKKKKKTTTTTSTTKKKKKTTTTTEATTKKKKKKTTTTTTTVPQTEATTAAPTEGNPYIELTYPCPNYKKITCGFGAYKGHTGCDFSTNKNQNQPIVAAESGTVILVKLLEYSYGHYVVIRHDKKTMSGKVVYTLYAHNNDIIVSEGQYVTKGQQIAFSGTTGNSTGPHCHFEVRVGGSSQSYAVNPASYLP